MLRALAVVSVALSLAGCREPVGSTDAGDSVDSDADYPYPMPRSDLVPAVGTQDSLDVATWNIENFPKGSATPEILADLITSMGLDIVAIEEVGDTAALEETIARLRDYDSVVSSHVYSDQTYQKLAFVFRRGLVSAEGGALLFTSDGLNFPRPPLKLSFTAGGQEFENIDFTAIAIHLKAGNSGDDRQRRADAMVTLEEYVRSSVEGIADPDVIVLGDYNDIIESSTVFGPVTGNPDRYRLRTAPLDAAGEVSFLPSHSLIDHVVTTSDMDAEIADGTIVIPPLDDLMGGYEGTVSDHLPVVLRIPLQPKP